MATKPSNLTNKTIAEYARRIGEQYKIYDPMTGRADLDALMAKLGGRVEPESDSESLRVRSRGDFTVFIPQFTSRRRDRFTIAHELGHYVLHYVYPRSRQGGGPDRSESLTEATFARGGRDRAETEANVFASALLMHPEWFRDAYDDCDGDEWKLASRFEVSPAAASVRSQVLGLSQ